MSVLDVNAQDWEKEVLKSNTLVIVDFWHENCPWCKILNPIFLEVSEDYKDRVKFAKLNALLSQENRDIAIENGVMSTPTLMFFCNGRSVGTAVGFQKKGDLTKIVNEMLEKHQECLDQSTEL